jgi:hypothetical protein
MPRRRTPPTISGPGGMLQSLPAFRPPPSQPDTAQQDGQVARALERSRRIGDMLLAREEEELQKIQSLAEELINRELRIPSNGRPCEDKAAGCLRCYQEHAENPLACAEFVEAYRLCANQAVLRVSTPAKLES